MMNLIFNRFSTIIWILCSVNFSFAQTLQTLTIQGTILEEKTNNPIEGVHVILKNTLKGTHTNAHGSFSMEIGLHDTLTFRCIGYRSISRAGASLMKERKIYLAQSAVVLPSLITIGLKIPKKDFTPMVSTGKTVTWWNEDDYKNYSDMAPVFGPHIKISLNNLWNNKREKEERKFKKLKKENERTMAYTSVVTNEEIKKAIVKQFNLSDAEYHNTLASFNEDREYLRHSTDTAQIIQELFLYFGSKTPQTKE